MKAAKNDLENQGYEDREFSFLDAAGKEYFHAAGIQALYVALVKARHTYLTGIPGGVAALLDSLRPLEQALLKARSSCKATADDDDRSRLEWSKLVGYKDPGPSLGKISHNTLKRRLTDSAEPVAGKIRYKAVPKARLIQVVVSDLPVDVQARFRQIGKQASS